MAKHKFSPVVISYFQQVYKEAGSFYKSVFRIREEHGYKLSHDTFRKIIDDPDDYTRAPHLYD